MNLVLKPEKNKKLRDLLIERNISIESPCGGMGKCGKCKIKLIRGETNPAADEYGNVSACKTELLTECEFLIPDYYETTCDIRERVFEYAVCDIGTTNIKINKYSADGVILESCFFRNPQFPFGADVISRITSCKTVGHEKLSQTLRECIKEKLAGVNKFYVCGNPTMIHFMAGVDPSPIGVFPFEPVFKNIKQLENMNGVLLPSASGYVGSDAVCCIYSVLKNETNGCVLVADLGTNGEISLIKNDKIYSATTAAGPAIEGAGIEMGMCGGTGVIYGFEGNKPVFEGEKACGINGCGLISVISRLLEKNLLSSNGHMKENKHFITDDVYISRKDIGEFMLAKSAVRTAMEIISEETKTPFSEVDRLILTGGVCNNLNLKDGARVGLIPEELVEKTEIIANLAISGVETAVIKNEISCLEDISEKIKVLSLSDNESFEERFILNSFFDDCFS